MDAWVLKLGLPMGACWLYSAWPCCHLPQPFDCQPPNSPRSPLHPLQSISLQQHSHSCLPPLTPMTAETPKQLELMTLVSREIVCLLSLTPDQPDSLSLSLYLSDSCAHTEKPQTCARPCSHSRSPNTRTHVY